MNDDPECKLVCEKCGREIRGEICEKCYTEEDQCFSSDTPGQNITRHIMVFSATGLLALAYFGASEVFLAKNRFIETVTRFFLFLAIYNLYMAIIFLLVAIGKITKEQAIKLDPLSRTILPFFKK